jgi:hypothetical protein
MTLRNAFDELGLDSTLQALRPAVAALPAPSAATRPSRR